jgi:hypothetical protein
MALEPHGRAPSIRSKAWSITQESISPDREEPFWLKLRRSKQQRYYEVKISARGLKWANLQRYLQLEFGDEAILKDQPEMVSEQNVKGVPRLHYPSLALSVLTTGTKTRGTKLQISANQVTVLPADGAQTGLRRHSSQKTQHGKLPSIS